MDLRENISASLKDVRDHGQRLLQLNLELLAAELKAKGAMYGAAVGMVLVACVLSLYALGFALATFAVALSLVLPLWLALLIVTAILVLVMLILVLVARASIRRAGAPVPQRAIDEAQTTADVLKEHAKQAKSAIDPRRLRATGPETPAGQAPPHEPAWPVRPRVPDSGPGESNAEDASGHSRRETPSAESEKS
jgi:membrane protein implicated in regulation of membrane protease activity